MLKAMLSRRRSVTGEGSVHFGSLRIANIIIIMPRIYLTKRSNEHKAAEDYIMTCFRLSNSNGHTRRISVGFGGENEWHVDFMLGDSEREAHAARHSVREVYNYRVYFYVPVYEANRDVMSVRIGTSYVRRNMYTVRGAGSGAVGQ